MLRAESVASSKIKGLEAGPRRLLDAETVLALGGEAADRIAVEVLANVAAMEAAVELGSSTDTITLDDLLGIHRTLMERSATPGIGGVVRTVQNWIGGSNYNPCSQRSSRHHRTPSTRCSTICLRMSTGTIILPSCRRSPTFSSRRSTRSPMGTAAPGRSM